MLLCGERSEGTAKIALDQIASSLDSFSVRAFRFFTDSFSDEALSFGPFCARVILENGCAALVGRFDTFRLLYLSEFQGQPEYEYGRRAKSSFAWSIDVIPEEKSTQPLWSLDHDLPKISRALLSRHLDHIVWRPAVLRMIDYVSTLGPDPLLADVLSIDPDRYIEETRGRSSQLYSTLSKGVHWEFFTSALLFDETTVKSAIRDTFILVANLGLISHFAHTSYACLEPQKAIDCYRVIRRLLP